MPISSLEGLRRSNEQLALRSKVSLTAFRIAWGWVAQHPEAVYESTAAELADEADRCHDLRELRREYSPTALRQTEDGPDIGMVRRPRVPAGV